MYQRISLSPIAALILVLLTILILTSCGANSKEHRQRTRELREKLKADAENMLNDKYDIKYQWDTLDYTYSIEYEQVLNSGYQLILDPYISDIYKDEKVFKVRVQCSYNYYFTLSTIDPNIIQNLTRINSIEPYGSNIMMVVDIGTIKKGFLELYAIPEYDDEAYIELESAHTFYAEGQLIEIQYIDDEK